MNREGLIDTPDRIARMYEEIYGGMEEDAATHLSRTFTVDSSEMVVEKDITFYSIRKGIRCYIQDSHNISFMLYVKFLSANNHIFISIFFSSSLQLHCSFTGHAKQFLERLSHS